MKKRLILLLLLGKCLMAAQSLVSSNTTIRTCINEKECSSVNNPSYLFYDERKNEFYLKLDPSQIREINTVNEWLKDLGDTCLYFKGNFPKDNFPATNSYQSKTYQVNGQSYINTVWRDQTVEITIFTSEDQTLNPAAKASEYDAYNVNFSFSFQPRDYDLHTKPHQLKNPIFITVTLGRINSLKPGMEDLVREAYDHN
jgi:hypothetical protein